MAWNHARKQRIVVKPKVVVAINKYGNNVLGEGVPIVYENAIVQRATVSAFSSRERNEPDEGYQPFSRFTVIIPGATSWPGGLHTTIEWKGETYDQYGEALVYETGVRTQHVSLIMQARGSQVR